MILWLFIIFEIFSFYHLINGSQDLSLNQYMESGSIGQLEYASKRLSKSPPLIAFIHKPSRASVILKMSPKRNKLMSKSINPPIDHLIEDTCSISGIGYAPDLTESKKYLFSLLQQYHFQYGSYPNYYYLAKKLSAWVIRGLYPQEDDVLRRPLAVSLLLWTIDRDNNDTPELSYISNLGIAYTTTRLALGNINEEQFKTIQSNIIKAQENTLLTMKDLKALVCDIIKQFVKDYDGFNCFFWSKEQGSQNIGGLITDADSLLNIEQ